MVPTLFCYELGLIALVWVFLMLYWLWPNDSAARRQPIALSKPPRRKPPKPPKLCAGLAQKPSCALCEHAAAYPHHTPPLASPDPMPPTSRRPRRVDTSRHFCPIGAVAIAAGSGWATYAPMDILMAAPGDNSSVRRARATFPSIMARSCMASRSPWS
jgi:hypothetical protein